MAKHGTAPAVIERPESDAISEEERRQAMERFWQTADQIRERNAGMDPDEEFAFITEVVEEVRQERYERAQREAADRR